MVVVEPAAEPEGPPDALSIAQRKHAQVRQAADRLALSQITSDAQRQRRASYAEILWSDKAYAGLPTWLHDREKNYEPRHVHRPADESEDDDAGTDLWPLCESSASLYGGGSVPSHGGRASSTTLRHNVSSPQLQDDVDITSLQSGGPTPTPSSDRNSIGSAACERLLQQLRRVGVQVGAPDDPDDVPCVRAPRRLHLDANGRTSQCPPSSTNGGGRHRRASHTMSPADSSSQAHVRPTPPASPMPQRPARRVTITGDGQGEDGDPATDRDRALTAVAVEGRAEGHTRQPPAWPMPADVPAAAVPSTNAAAASTATDAVAAAATVTAAVAATATATAAVAAAAAAAASAAVAAAGGEAPQHGVLSQLIKKAFTRLLRHKRRGGTDTGGEQSGSGEVSGTASAEESVTVPAAGGTSAEAAAGSGCGERPFPPPRLEVVVRSPACSSSGSVASPLPPASPSVNQPAPPQWQDACSAALAPSPPSPSKPAGSHPSFVARALRNGPNRPKSRAAGGPSAAAARALSPDPRLRSSLSPGASPDASRCSSPSCSGARARTPGGGGMRALQAETSLALSNSSSNSRSHSRNAVRFGPPTPPPGGAAVPVAGGSAAEAAVAALRKSTGSPAPTGGPQNLIPAPMLQKLRELEFYMIPEPDLEQGGDGCGTPTDSRPLALLSLNSVCRRTTNQLVEDAAGEGSDPDSPAARPGRGQHHHHHQQRTRTPGPGVAAAGAAGAATEGSLTRMSLYTAASGSTGGGGGVNSAALHASQARRSSSPLFGCPAVYPTASASTSSAGGSSALRPTSSRAAPVAAGRHRRASLDFPLSSSSASAVRRASVSSLDIPWVPSCSTAGSTTPEQHARFAAAVRRVRRASLQFVSSHDCYY